MVSKMNRDSLICYKEKKKFEIENNITFKFPYDFNFLSSKKIIYESFNNIRNRYDFLKDKKLIRQVPGNEEFAKKSVFDDEKSKDV